MHTDLR